MKNRWLSATGLMLLGVVAFGARPAQALTVTPDEEYVLGAIETAIGDASTSTYGAVSAASVSPSASASDPGRVQAFGGGSGLTFTPVSQGIGAGSAKATADISTGTLLTYSQSMGLTFTYSVPSVASGSAFWDTLSLNGPGGTATFDFVVPGDFVDPGSPGAAQGAAYFSTGTPSFSALTTCFATIGLGGSCANGALLNDGNELALLQSTVTLAPGPVTEELFAADASEVSGAAGLSTADMFDPPTLSLTLPAGETFTSASGVFPGSSAASVPEPSTLLLLGSGLAGLGFVRKRFKA